MTHKKDKNNIALLNTVSDKDLQAYVDGCLSKSRHIEVEAYLARHPEKQAEIEDYIRYDELLRSAHDEILEEDVPPDLMNVLRRPHKNWLRSAQKYAAVILLCFVSAMVGRLSVSFDDVEQTKTLAGDFLQHVAMSAEDFEGNGVGDILNIKADKKIDPLNWLTQKVALEMQAPDLAQAGYSLEERKLVSRDAQEFVQLIYRGQGSDKLKLYMKTRWDKEAPEIKFTSQNGNSVVHWQEGPLVYALTGDIDRKAAVLIADLVRTSMTNVPDKQPMVKNTQIISNAAPLTASNNNYEAEQNVGLITEPAMDHIMQPVMQVPAVINTNEYLQP